MNTIRPTITRRPRPSNDSAAAQLERSDPSRPGAPGAGRRLSLAVLVCVAAMLAGLLTAGSANADTFSPYLQTARYINYFANCTIDVGAVYDHASNPHGFAVIGGGQISCRTPHTFQVWTQEYYSSSGASNTYYHVGTDGYASYTNSYGSAIVETGRICESSGHWFTYVIVAAQGYTPTTGFPGYAQGPVAANGYSSSFC